MEPIWQSHYFKRIFKTMCLVTFPVLLLALIVLYTSFYYSTQTYLNSVSQRLMSNTTVNIRYQMDCSKKNALNAYTSSSGVTLMAANGASPVDTLRAMRDIEYFLSQDSIIRSVYFFNSRTQQIYMFGNDLRQGDITDFHDTEIVKIVTTNSSTQSSAFPRVIPPEYEFLEPYPTVTSYYRMANGDYVIINLNVNTLFGVLRNDPAVYSNAPTNYFVLHNKTQLVYQSVYHEELADSGSNEISRILNKHNYDKSFSDKIKGVAFHFNVLYDSESNCHMVSVIRQSDLATGFLPFHLLFIVICVAGCLMAIIVTLKFSTRLYKPVDRLKKMFPAGENGSGHDEFEYIAQNITSTASRLENLFEYKEKSLSLSQSELIKKQMLYNQYSDEEFWQQCKNQELPYSFGDRFVLLYARWTPLNAASERLSGDQRTLCYAISNVFHELLDGQIDSQDLPFEDNGIAFLCCFKHANGQITDNSILSSIQKTFAQYFGLSLSFFISRKFTSPSQMHTSMRKLQELSDYRYFHENGCIMRENEIDFDALHSELCPLPDMAQLENAIRSADKDTCKSLIEIYFAALPKYTCDSAIASINLLASKLITLMKKIQASHPAFPEINYHSFFHTVTSASSLMRAYTFVLMPLTEIMDSFNAPGNDIESLLSDEVLRYLEQNYQDYNLSSKSIAKHHHVSVPYLNRILKQKTGETIASYVKNLRLERSRQLLLSSNLSVEAIAKKVGFENTKYFYTLFKAEYGVSPSSYRVNGSILSSAD